MRTVSWKRWFWGTGRTARQEYWFGFAGLVAASWGAHAVVQTIHTSNPSLTAYMVLPFLVGQAAITWLWACLIGRRLHDIGRSAWWQLLPVAVVFGGAALAEPVWATALGLDETTSAAAWIAAIAVYLSFTIAVGLVQGTREPNRFGAPAA